MKVLPKALLALGVVTSAVYYLLPPPEQQKGPAPIILEISPPANREPVATTTAPVPIEILPDSQQPVADTETGVAAEQPIDFSDSLAFPELKGIAEKQPSVEGDPLPDETMPAAIADPADNATEELADTPENTELAEESEIVETDDAESPPFGLDFSESLSIQPDASPEATDEVAEIEEPASRWQEHEIRSGDTLARVFDNLGLSTSLLYEVLDTSDETQRLADLRPGQKISVRLNEEGQLEELVHERSDIAKLHVVAEPDGFAAAVKEKSLEVRIEHAAATIDSSLFADGQDAGLSNKVIMELAELFNWDIDFARELQSGDRFSVIFECRYVDGDKYDDGAILAAEFVNKGTTYRALRYRDPNGNVDYYAPDGSSKKKAFIKTPVKFARISSKFSKRRWHPVLKRWRSHKGVDYAAPTGTPIRAAGKGTVSFVGRQRGYGKVVYLKHGDRYETVYGHMSKFARGLDKGDTVKQGEVIGYVGKTGLATGPHLHYEFRVNGKHVDPLSHKLPTAMPLPKRYMADFKANTESLVEQLNLLSAPRVANQEATTSNP